MSSETTTPIIAIPYIPSLHIEVRLPCTILAKYGSIQGVGLAAFHGVWGWVEQSNGRAMVRTLRTAVDLDGGGYRVRYRFEKYGFDI